MTLIVEKKLVKFFEVRDGKLQSYAIVPPERHLDQIRDLGRQRDERVGPVIRTLIQSQAVLERSARRLNKLFGQSPVEIRKTLGLLIDDTHLFEMDLDSLEDMVLEGETVLRGRAERVGFEFSALTLKECQHPDWLIAQVLGWAKLIEHSEAELLDERYNMVQGTAEKLYQFRGIRLLIANCRGTGLPELMPVDPRCATCEEAQDWLSGNTIRGLGLPKYFSRGRT